MSDPNAALLAPAAPPLMSVAHVELSTDQERMLVQAQAEAENGPVVAAPAAAAGGGYTVTWSDQDAAHLVVQPFADLAAAAVFHQDKLAAGFRPLTL